MLFWELLKSQRHNFAKIRKTCPNTFGKRPGLCSEEMSGCCSAGCSDFEASHPFVIIDALARRFISFLCLQEIRVCAVSRGWFVLQVWAADLPKLGLIPTKQQSNNHLSLALMSQEVQSKQPASPTGVHLPFSPKAYNLPQQLLQSSSATPKMSLGETISGMVFNSCVCVCQQFPQRVPWSHAPIARLV